MSELAKIVKGISTSTSVPQTKGASLPNIEREVKLEALAKMICGSPTTIV